MKALIVTAFYDVGRSAWEISPRTSSDYARYADGYIRRINAPKYILTEHNERIAENFDFVDYCSLSNLNSYAMLDKSKKIISSQHFQSLVRDAPTDRIEYHYAEYNIIGLAKWDALERAYAHTAGNFSHYIWLDYGLARRGSKSPFLPPITNISPKNRNKIVLSAKKSDRISNLSFDSLKSRILKGKFACAGGMQIVPAHLVNEYAQAVRETYNFIITMNLCANDQVVLDVLSFNRPEIFHLSTPPKHFDVFENIDRILRGKDGAWDLAKLPVIKKWAAHRAKLQFIKRL